MFYRLITQTIVGIFGIWLAIELISEVSFSGPIFPKLSAGWEHFKTTLFFIGIIIGILNSVVKPILNFISLPLRIITLNLFSLIIAMGLIWLVDFYFNELTISGIISLFWTTMIIWILSLLFPPIKKNKNPLNN